MERMAVHVYARDLGDRMKEGVTRPWLCEADDGCKYVVKPATEIPPYELVSEWISCNLAREFGLPTPEVRIVHNVNPLLKLKGEPVGLDDNYPAFGSRYIEQTTALTYSQSMGLSGDFKKKLLIFDYWIQNADRNLSRDGGNVNLIYSPFSEEVFVFDHNQAFDRNFSCESFLQHHVFSGENRGVAIDQLDRALFGPEFEHCLEHWDAIVSQIPPEWIDGINPAGNVDNVLETSFLSILRRCENDNFLGRIAE